MEAHSRPAQPSYANAVCQPSRPPPPPATSQFTLMTSTFRWLPISPTPSLTMSTGSSWLKLSVRYHHSNSPSIPGVLGDGPVQQCQQRGQQEPLILYRVSQPRLDSASIPLENAAFIIYPPHFWDEVSFRRLLFPYHNNLVFEDFSGSYTGSRLVYIFPFVCDSFWSAVFPSSLRGFSPGASVLCLTTFVLFHRMLYCIYV